MTRPNRNVILRSKPRGALPGDPVRILTAKAVDRNGVWWPAGTEFTPQYSGTSMLPEFSGQQVVIIGGRHVTFYRAACRA